MRRYPLRRKARERGEHGVGDSVGGLDVPGDDRRGVGRVDEAPLGGLNDERPVGAGVGEDVLREQDTKSEIARRAGYGEGAVYVAANGVGGAREVYLHRVALHGHRGLYGDVIVGDAVALHAVLGGVLPVGEVADGLACALLCVRDDLIEGGEDRVLASAVYKLGEALFCDVVRGDLGPQVTAPEAGGADVGEEEVHHVGHVFAVAHQTHRRDDDALLEDLARVARHGAGTHPAHVGVVGPRHRVPDNLSLVGDGRDERYVGQMRPARVRVVYGEDVARLRVAAHYGSNGLGHRPEVDGDVLGLGDHQALLVEERRRAVAPLLDVR